MRMPSKRQLRSLEKATVAYETELGLAIPYLIDRGISLETAHAARLGVVVSPEAGHEIAQGRLCIPYVNKIGVIGLKFRCLQGHDCKAVDCPKYIVPVGQDEYLYGLVDVDEDSDVIHICEGEIDRLIVKQVLGEPAVGIPGATKWGGVPTAHWPWHFKGWGRVLCWADGDKAGRDMANRIRKDIANVEVVPIPSGHDVNSVFLELGAEAIRKLAGLEEDD